MRINPQGLKALELLLLEAMAYVALVHGACENGHTSDAEEFFEAAAGRLLNPQP